MQRTKTTVGPCTRLHDASATTASVQVLCATGNRHVLSTIVLSNDPHSSPANKPTVHSKVKVLMLIIHAYLVGGRRPPAGCSNEYMGGAILDFYSSQLPRIDICSLQSLQGLKEGFIHTPNYPGGYPNSKACSKTVPSPGADHR